MSTTATGLPEGAQLWHMDTFTMENGDTLTNVPLAYTTYGTLNEACDNAVLVGHSLTSNTNVHEWWSELLGDGAPGAF